MRSRIRFSAGLWAYSFALWTAYSLLYSGSIYLWLRSAGHPVRYWSETLFLPLLNHWINAALTPMVLVVALRYPFRRNKWFRAVLLHTAGMSAFVAAHMGLRLLLNWIYPIRNQFTGEVVQASVALFRNMFLYGLREDGIQAYLLIVVLAQLLFIQQESSEREIQAEQLRGRLAEARLEALKLQLKPHFLFNTLNAVSELVHDDPASAEQVVLRLSELLRFVIRSFDRNLISLAEELELLKIYIGIEKIRFAGRLQFSLKVEEEALSAQVPCLLLQPIVENAIGHGIGKRSGTGSIDVRIAVKSGTLAIQVIDDGPGLPLGFDSAETDGVGLRNTRERLQHLFPASASLTISNGAHAGVIVLITLPLLRSELRTGGRKDECLESSYRG